MGSEFNSQTSGVKVSDKEVVIIGGEMNSDGFKMVKGEVKGPVYGKDTTIGLTGKPNELIQVQKAVIQEKFKSLDDHRDKKPVKIQVFPDPIEVDEPTKVEPSNIDESARFE